MGRSRQEDREARRVARELRLEAREARARRGQAGGGFLVALLAAAVSLVGFTVAARAYDAGRRPADVAGGPAPRVRAVPAEPAPAPAPAPTPTPEPAPTSAPDPEPPAAPEPEPKPAPAPKQAPEPLPAVQRLSVGISGVGFDPTELTVKAGVPIEITVAQGEGCAAGFAMPDLGKYADNSAGSVTLALGPLKAGTYTYTCGMGMVEGRLVVR